MIIEDEIKDLRKAIADINLRLNSIRLAAIGAHNLLSSDHPDTVAASPVAGDIIYGNATPKWARRAKKNDGDVLTLVAGYPDWATPSAATIDFADNFADASRYWAWKDLNTSGVVRTITESGGVLTLANTAGNGGDWWTGSNQSVRCVIGCPGFPCTIETKLNDFTVNDVTHVGMFLSLEPYGAAPSANSALLWGRLRFDAAGRNCFSLQALGGTPTTDVASTTLPMWLRFRIGNDCYSMTLVYADYSTDGTNWTNAWTNVTWPTAYFNNLATGLFIKTWAANSAISAPFEYFKMYRDVGPG